MIACTLLHIALLYEDEFKADIFFGRILGLKVVKNFVLVKDFSNSVFNINKDVKVKMYSDGNVMFEIFFAKGKFKNTYSHICLLIDDKANLIKKCRKYKIEIITKNINNKNYLFIKDYSGYIYEIK